MQAGERANRLEGDMAKANVEAVRKRRDEGQQEFTREEVRWLLEEYDHQRRYARLLEKEIGRLGEVALALEIELKELRDAGEGLHGREGRDGPDEARARSVDTVEVRHGEL